jgi:hypothetical protein
MKRASGIQSDDEGNCLFLGYFFWARKRSTPGVQGPEPPRINKSFWSQIEQEIPVDTIDMRPIPY